jgi:hypothetical protein
MNPYRRLFAAALIAIAWPVVAWAELQVEEKDVDEGHLTVFKMTVTPAAEPVPALKHRLLLREIDEKSGNAATMYYRAFAAGENLDKQLRDKFGKEYANEYPWPDEAWPSEKLKGSAEIIASSQVLDHLREAALRQNCDWGFDLRSIRGTEMYSFLLPELQQARQLARHVNLLTRVAIHERRYDDAIDNLRINLELARDMGSEPLLIGGLVGIAIAGVGDRAVIDLIAAPDAPNLYWALTELPDPIIDFRPALRFEMSSVFRVFPFLRDAETQEHSAEEWARLMAEGLELFASLTGGSSEFSKDGSTARMGVAALGVATYGPAKQRLIAGGMDAELVERMPVGQVMSVDAAREFRRIADEYEKWWYLPYATARDHSDDPDDLFQGNKLVGGYGRILAGILLPAISAARTAQERHQYQTDGLRTVEAIRMHAAETGKLPRSLDDIRVVPVPVNRVTGRAYQYRLDGDKGVLDLPFSDGFPNIAWRFEIKLAD